KFGSVNALKFKVNTSKWITAEAPPGVGTVDVTVSTARGTSAHVIGDQFTYLPPEKLVLPVVSSVAPDSGPEAGGTSVTISGSEFTGATAVKFGVFDALKYKV